MSTRTRTRAEAEAEAQHVADYGPPRPHELFRDHQIFACRCGDWHGDSLAAGVRHLRQTRALDADREDGREDGRDG